MYRLRCNAHQAKAGPQLTPVLGQIGVKAPDFIVEFTKQSLQYVEGLTLSCRLLRGGPRFVLHVIPPTLMTLFWGSSDFRSLSVGIVYDVFAFRVRMRAVRRW